MFGFCRNPGYLLLEVVSPVLGQRRNVRNAAQSLQIILVAVIEPRNLGDGHRVPGPHDYNDRVSRLDLTLDDRPQLALMRHVSPGGSPASTLQGVILDWDRVRSALQHEIDDLFTNARLVPAPSHPPIHPDMANAVLDFAARWDVLTAD